MDKPICRLCGQKHGLGEAHVFKGATPPIAVTRNPLAFDRKAYQRAYMRFYRRKQALMVQTAKALLDHVAEPWPRA